MTLVGSQTVVATAQLELSDLEPYRRELTGYCYRMLGSGFEAEDAVQETMIKALRGASGFEGRASVRSWLYRIATNVCIDMTRQVQRRARPMELGPASPPDESFLGPLRPEAPWVTPIADGKVMDPAGDPAEVATQRESVRLAFVTALQHLPARQRAALVLCEVLSWSAADAAELLDTTVAAINSALQRARAALAQLPAGGKPRPLDAKTDDLLKRYVDAFERYDMDALVKLLHDDAYQSMPPFAMWVQGAENITAWMLQPGPSGCRGSRLIALGDANGCPAFAQYKPDPAGGLQPWGIQLLEISGGKISELAMFLSPLDPERLFPSFGLPLRLES
jgi:RNA polymerase sigma-70 factor (ECF subfamily)